MKNKSLAIILLSVTATGLLLANIFLAPTASGAAAIKDRDYQLVTARIDIGGEGLYVIDNRTGLVAVFSYDFTSRTVVARAVRPVADAFQALNPRKGR